MLFISYRHTGCLIRDPVENVLNGMNAIVSSENAGADSAYTTRISIDLGVLRQCSRMFRLYGIFTARRGKCYSRNTGIWPPIGGLTGLFIREEGCCNAQMRISVPPRTRNYCSRVPRYRNTLTSDGNPTACGRTMRHLLSLSTKSFFYYIEQWS